MPSILIIEKTGVIKPLNVKEYDSATLYKKAGFKTDTDFKLQTTWAVALGSTKYFVSVYGKSEGRANQENKYDFPPPVDTVLFFGSCVLVNRDENDNVADLSVDTWEKIYEHLFGGFEDIGDSESESEDDSEFDDAPRTSTGYVKDGFVVDDDAESEESEEEEIVVVAKKAKRGGKKVVPLSNTVIPDKQESYLDCTSELSEEAYFE